MLIPNHISYLRLADSVLNNLNLPYKSYTSTHEELFKRVNSDVPYEKIYANEWDRFFLEGYDTTSEISSKSMLFNSILLFLKDEGLIHYDHKNIILSYKGILKILYGFEDDYIKEKLEIEKARIQQNYDNGMNLFKSLTPYLIAILTFIIGKLL